MMTPTMSARRVKTRGIDKLPARKPDASDSSATATQPNTIRAMTDPVRTPRRAVEADMDEDSFKCRVVPALAFTVQVVLPECSNQQASTPSRYGKLTVAFALMSFTSYSEGLIFCSVGVTLYSESPFLYSGAV